MDVKADYSVKLKIEPVEFNYDNVGCEDFLMMSRRIKGKNWHWKTNTKEDSRGKNILRRIKYVLSGNV